jgi:hypothetical protein
MANSKGSSEKSKRFIEEKGTDLFIAFPISLS